MNNFFESLDAYDQLIGSEYNAMKQAGMPKDMLSEADKVMKTAKYKLGEKMYAFMSNGTYKVNTPIGQEIRSYTVPWSDKTLMKNKAVADIYRQLGQGNRFRANEASKIASVVAPTKQDKRLSKAISDSVARTRKEKQLEVTKKRNKIKKDTKSTINKLTRAPKKAVKKVIKTAKKVGKKVSKVVKRAKNAVKKGIKKFTSFFKRKKR